MKLLTDSAEKMPTALMDKWNPDKCRAEAEGGFRFTNKICLKGANHLTVHSISGLLTMNLLGKAFSKWDVTA